MTHSWIMPPLAKGDVLVLQHGARRFQWTIQSTEGAVLFGRDDRIQSIERNGKLLWSRTQPAAVPAPTGRAVKRT